MAKKKKKVSRPLGGPKTSAKQTEMRFGDYNERQVSKARGKLIMDRNTEGFGDKLPENQSSFLDEVNFLKSRNKKLERPT